MTSRDARRLAVHGYLGLVRFKIVNFFLGLLLLAALPPVLIWLLRLR